MFNFLKNIFKSKNKNDLTDEKGNLIHKSSVKYFKNNQRFLRLNNDSCAIIIHDDNNIEVVLTKHYDAENQNLTENEEELMALAVFMKQDGFLSMILDEFRKIVKNTVNLTKEDNK